jgi:Domain of unknown function (DUF4390)
MIPPASPGFTMRRVVFALCSLLLLSAPVAADQQTLQVVPLTRDGQVLVTFKLEQAFTEDTRAAIHSGLPISFVYRIQLKRSSAAWVDRTIASTEVRTTVKYNTQTKRYHVTRYVDNSIEDMETIEQEEVAWAWLTSRFERMPLFQKVKLETNGEYYLRVSAHSSPRNAAFVWPWQIDDVVGLAKFTVVR